MMYNFDDKTYEAIQLYNYYHLLNILSIKISMGHIVI